MSDVTLKFKSGWADHPGLVNLGVIGIGELIACAAGLTTPSGALVRTGLIDARGDLSPDLPIKVTKPATSKSAERFDEFWSAWPSHQRKVAKAKCLSMWVRKNLDKSANEILAHVEAMKCSKDWIKNGGEFIPAPLVYLNQERYLAPTGPTAATTFAQTNYRQGVNEDGTFN